MCSDWSRFNDQFRETPFERNERQRKARERRARETLWDLIAHLSAGLTDEGPDWTTGSLIELRKRVANALPPDRCPDWLNQYRDPQITAGST